MSIFILEDHPIQAENLKTYIEQQQEKYHKEISIVSTSRPNEILQQIPFSEHLNLYFLDIEIKKNKYGGLDTAKQIRELDSEGIIVFITTHAELAPMSYKYMVSALTFIEKSNWNKMSQAIADCLSYYYERIDENESQPVFIFSNAYTSFRMPYYEILYIQTAENHRLNLISTKQMIQFYGSLKEIQAALEDQPQFVRPHQSYIANMDNVRELSKRDMMLTFIDGKQLPISRRLSKNIIQAWKKVK